MTSYDVEGTVYKYSIDVDEMTTDLTMSTSTTPKPIIALDCDGVLLDYSASFVQIYEKTFGKQLTLVEPKAYHTRKQYGVNFNEEEKVQFDEIWDKDGWRTMPMHDGALEACLLLHEAGYELICVTAMPARFIEHRLENFRSHGFPIAKVISATYHPENFYHNPKREVIEQLHPVVFVDDLRRNFLDIAGVHTKFIYIDHERVDDPNEHDNIYYDIKYPSLRDFVKDFLKSEQHGEEIEWSPRPSHLLPSI